MELHWGTKEHLKGEEGGSMEKRKLLTCNDTAKLIGDTQEVQLTGPTLLPLP